MNPIRFTCTALTGTGKQGILPKDSNGYYTQPIGALNIFNSAGDYYPAEPARQLFDKSGALMRRISTGCLKSEYGHPKRGMGQSDDEFANRVMTIDERNICAHIGSIELDFDSVKDDCGRPVVAMIAKIAPSGPLATALERSMQNPNEDVCFSIRAFTEDLRISGIKHRVLREIVTWDYVVEPGINVARKYRAPALEHYGNELLTKDTLKKVVAHQATTGVAMESGAMSGVQLFKSLGWEFDPAAIPKYLSW